MVGDSSEVGYQAEIFKVHAEVKGMGSGGGGCHGEWRRPDWLPPDFPGRDRSFWPASTPEKGRGALSLSPNHPARKPNSTTTGAYTQSTKLSKPVEGVVVLPCVHWDMMWADMSCLQASQPAANLDPDLLQNQRSRPKNHRAGTEDFCECGFMCWLRSEADLVGFG